MENVYYAHIADDGRKQTVKEHDTNVANLASIFGKEFSLETPCKIAGLYHDIGKYSVAFQKRLLENAPKVDHSSAGAIETFQAFPHEEIWGMIFAYVIAGHHSGLQDYGSPESGVISRLQKKQMLPDYEAFRSEYTMPDIEKPMDFFNMLFSHGQPKHFGFRISFMIRMIYSALVDADFLDTEAFMNFENQALRQNFDTWETLKARYKKHMAMMEEKAKKTSVNQLRKAISNRCISMGKGDSGFYTLTVPTGGGKTLASMGFALEQKKNRVLYVIPYTSIIQQTADVFREIFGAKNVLEHHSNYDFFKEGLSDYETAKSLYLSSENWDIPITVTTNVQFFESLFANKSSRCRKLHRLANSVIILDEAQMIPVYYLKPCLLALEELVNHYGATVVFCTATKPEFPPEILSSTPIEIMEAPQKLYTAFQRTEIEWIGEKTDEEMIAFLSDQEHYLCVVNKINHAKRLYLNTPSKHKYHLSGNMCHCHRDEILNTIRQCLKDKEPCALFSTQLIECGVDISFPVVVRAMAGLDSVIQAAGRCNRENELAAGGKLGKVFVFQPSEEINQLRGYQQVTASCGHRIINTHEDVASIDTISAYFKKLYSTQGEKLDFYHILDYFDRGAKQMSFQFETAAKDFHLIEDRESLVIPYDEEAVRLINDFSVTESKSVLKKLQKYMISIYPQQKEALKKRGGIKPLGENLYALTTKADFYDDEVGLNIADEMENLIY